MRTDRPVILAPARTAGVKHLIMKAGQFFIPAIVICVLIAPSAPVRAAPPPVDLQLCAIGSTPWNITNIKPGDCGVQMLSMCNAGNRSGALTIWISDICDCEGANPEPETGNTGQPGELSQYLLFRPVSNRLSANIPLPAILADFPQSTDDPKKITISPIAPGETIDLIWEWGLPTSVGNEVQGDCVSFTINYTLTEMPVTPVDDGTDSGGDKANPPAPPAPAPAPGLSAIIVTSPEKQVLVPTQGSGTVAETQTVLAISNEVTLSFERGTQIYTEDNSDPVEIQVNPLEVVQPEEMPPPPTGMTIVGPVYSLLLYTRSGIRVATLSMPARLILNYTPEELPPDASNLFIAFYDSQSGWTQLQPISDYIFREGQVGALISHFSLYAILAYVSPPETKPPGRPILPARFEVRDLMLSAEEVSPGELLTVRVNVINTGGMSGEHVLTLRVNGLFVDSKLVRLAPGQNRNFSFDISPYIPGTYEVDIDGLRETFTILEGPLKTSIWWPMPAVPILVGAGFLAMQIIVLFAYRKRRRRRDG